MKKIVFSALAAIISLITAAVVVFGWLADLSNIQPPQYSGAVNSSYFASGDGSVTSPYEINHPRHLYNLAWLQNIGYFNSTSEGKLNQNYFEISADLDMSGYVLPPIGTTEYPFMGNLNGGGKTIINLTVSNVKKTSDMPYEISLWPMGIGESDWLPASTEAEIVGFFGVIGNYGEKYASGSFDSTLVSVSNLFLDKLTVRTRTNNSLIGLFAGYVCGNVSDIGVYRSAVSIGSGVATLDATYSAHSKYAIIGDYDSSTTNWSDQTGSGSGGDLKIDPNATGDVFTAVSDGSYRAITGSVQNSAFFVGQLNATTINGGVKGQYLYNGETISTEANHEYYATGSTTVSNTNIVVSGTSINVTNANLYIEPSAANISTSNSTTTYLTDVLNVTLDTKTTSLPKKGIWFKPVSYGDCYVAFCQQDMKTDSYMSIYKFKRNQDGTINQSSIIITTFRLRINNKVVCFFNYPISKQDLNDDYEYFIGKTNNTSTTAGFVYLILAGTNIEGGKANTISGVKFVWATDDIAKSLKDFYTFQIVRSSTGNGVQVYFYQTDSTMYYYIDIDTTNTTVTPSVSTAQNNVAAKNNFGVAINAPS